MYLKPITVFLGQLNSLKNNTKLMKNYKTIYIAIFLGLFLSSCALDFEDANPERPLDGIAGIAADPVGDGLIAGPGRDGNMWTWVPVNGVLTFTIDISDAPGLVSSADVLLSNSVQPEDLGVATLSLGSAENSTEGTVTVTYTAGDVVGEENISIVVNDAQDPSKSTTFTYPAIKITDVSTCLSSQNLIGFYDAVSSGFDAENGVDYADLEATIELYFLAFNDPGYYRFSDGSFGLYGHQGFEGNFINVEICDNNVVNANEEFTDGYTGTISAEGVITITWSNTFGDTGVTILTPR